MDLARAADFQPFSFSRTAGEHHVHFSARLGEREVARTEANDEVVRFKEALQEVNIDALQVDVYKRQALGHFVVGDI